MERDIWFKSLILFLLISCLVGGYRGVTGIVEQSYVLPQWYYYLNVVLNIGGIVVLFFFYNFKKIGIIAFLACLVIDFLIQLILGETFNTASLFFIFLSALLIGVKVVPNWSKYA